MQETPRKLIIRIFPIWPYGLSIFDISVASSTQIMRQFVECLEAGDIRRELAEDCMVNLFGRSTKGLAAVMGFVRTQIAGRFKHMGFLEACVCDASHVKYLNDRFGHSLEMLRSRLKTQKKVNRPTTWLSRAESVEDIAASAEPVTPPNHLVTPPRSVISTATDGNTEVMHYIEAVGVLEPVNDPVDGDFSLDDPCQVKLTLGYRSGPPTYKGELALEFCIIVYEKYKNRTHTPSLQRQQRLRSPRNVCTDDEGDEPAPRSVRRILFASGACEQVADLEPIISPNLVLTRKRPHNNDSNIKSKRAVRLSRLRF